MKKTKFILSIILLAVIIMMSCAAAYAVPLAEAETAQNLLVNIAVMQKGADPEEKLTRGEFADYLAKLCGYNINAERKEIFSDVTGGTMYAGAIGALYEAGAISGYEGGKFFPNDYIEPNQAIKMIVCTLGGGSAYMAEENGGYPSGYLKEAAEMKVLKGINFENQLYLKRSEAAKLLYNTLFTTQRSVTSAAEPGRYSDNSSELFMERRLKLTYTEGMVTDNGITALDGRSTIKRGNITVDGITMEDVNNYSSFLGRKVVAFYTFENDEYVLIYAYETKDCKTFTVNHRDIKGYNDFKYSYNSGSREKTAEIEKDYILIYNNSVVTDGKAFEKACAESKNGTILYPESGYVELIDNDGNGKYDVVKVNEYDDMVVERYNPITNTVYDKINKSDSGSKFVNLDDYEEYVFCDCEDNIIQQDEAFTENTVLSVYKSLDKSYIKFVVSKEIIKNVAASKYDETEKQLILGEEQRYISKDYENQMIKEGGIVGLEGTFYLNAYGEIAYYLPADGTDFLGYLIKAFTDESGDRFKLKISTENGIKVYDIADRVEIDGQTIKNTNNKKLTELLSENMAEDEFRKIILFKLNSDEQIRYIDTCAQNADGSQGRGLYRIDTGSTTGFDSYTLNSDKMYTFSSTVNELKYRRAIYVSDTSVAVVASENGFTKDYNENNVNFVKSLSSLKNIGGNTSNKMYFYSYDKDGIQADVILLIPTEYGNRFGAGSYAEVGSVVKKIVTSVDDNDEIVTELTLEIYGQETKVKALEEDDILSFKLSSGEYSDGENNAEISVGDVVRVKKGMDGYIKKGGIHVIYDWSEKKYNSDNMNFREIVGGPVAKVVWPYIKKDGILAMAQINPFTETEAEHTTFMRKMDSVTILEFDTGTNTFKTITMDNIDTYTENSGDCLEGVWLNSRDWSAGGTLVLYR